MNTAYHKEKKQSRTALPELGADHTPKEGIQQNKGRQYALKFEPKPGERPRYTGGVNCILRIQLRRHFPNSSFHPAGQSDSMSTENPIFLQLIILTPPCVPPLKRHAFQSPPESAPESRLCPLSFQENPVSQSTGCFFPFFANTLSLI